jgi:hypothetical protein
MRSDPSPNRKWPVSPRADGAVAAVRGACRTIRARSSSFEFLLKPRKRECCRRTTGFGSISAPRTGCGRSCWRFRRRLRGRRYRPDSDVFYLTLDEVSSAAARHGGATAPRRAPPQEVAISGDHPTPALGGQRPTTP